MGAHYPKLRLFSLKRQIIEIVDSVDVLPELAFRSQQGKF